MYNPSYISLACHPNRRYTRFSRSLSVKQTPFVLPNFAATLFSLHRKSFDPKENVCYNWFVVMNRKLGFVGQWVLICLLYASSIARSSAISLTNLAVALCMIFRTITREMITPLLNVLALLVSIATIAGDTAVTLFGQKVHFVAILSKSSGSPYLDL